MKRPRSLVTPDIGTYRRDTGISLQASCVGEAASVVADLGQHPGTELDAETGKAEDDLSVRVLRESRFHRLREVVGGRAGGFQLTEESEHLLAQRILDQLGLVSPLGAEHLADPVGLGIDSAFATLHDPTSRTCYDKCRARGKTHAQALLRLARHRISVLLAMLRDGTFYEPRVPPATAA